VTSFLEKFSAWVFRHRTPLVCVFAALTAVMSWFAVRLHVDASFNKSLPTRHPYIQTFTKYQSEFGGANRVLVTLMARDGDIFTPEFFRELRQTTDAVMFLPAVDRPQVQSLFTPNVRYIEVVEDGFSGGNVIPADFTPTPANFAKVRENIVKSGKLGQLVANDFSGAIVSAQLLETDPRTGTPVTRYLFEGQRYFSREDAENIRAQKIGDIARGFYRDLPAALAARKGDGRLN